MQSGGGWGTAFRQLAAGVLITLSTAAWAQTPHVKIGLVLSLTGPAASLGIPARDTVALLPKEMGGRPVDYIILDDASDTTQAVQTTKKLISEDHVDAIIGSSITPNSLAMIDVVADGQTPMISLASSSKIIEPVDAKRHWVFKTPQTDAMMASAIAEHASNHGVKTMAFIGQADALGETFYAEVAKFAQLHHITMVANERFNRTDTERDRAGAEDPRGESGRGGRGRSGNARRVAAEDAERTRLQRHDLS